MINMDEKQFLTIMNDCCEVMVELIEDVVLLEKQIIEFNHKNVIENYISMATILELDTEKKIIYYANRFDIFIDTFKSLKEFFEVIERKDYKVVFLNEQYIDLEIIDTLKRNSIKVVLITSYPENYKDFDYILKKGNLLEYLKLIKKLKEDVIKNYKNKFYLQIIKNNHKEKLLDKNNWFNLNNEKLSRINPNSVVLFDFDDDLENNSIIFKR